MSSAKYLLLGTVIAICFVLYSFLTTSTNETITTVTTTTQTNIDSTTSSPTINNKNLDEQQQQQEEETITSKSSTSGRQQQNSQNSYKFTRHPLMPEYHDEIFNLTSVGDNKPVPPFLVRPAQRGKDLQIRWKCSPRKIGPFHVDAPSTPWPNCRMLDHDTEMKTFQYLVERVMCGLPVFGSQSEKIYYSNNNKNKNKKNKEKKDQQQQQSIEDDDASMQAHRPLRVLQIGANTGSNQNDPLVKLLMNGFAQAVLLEPVPWIFSKLHETYSSMAGMIALVQAAVSNKDGATTFMAPKPSMAGKGPWLHQMGGLNLPPRSVARLKRMGLMKEFKQITVASLTVSTVLQKFAPWMDKTGDDQMGLPAPPDVVVVDAEGFDAVIVNQILDFVALLDESGRTNEDGETVSVIQYENKHVPKKDNARLMERLVKMGYSVTQVYVDTVAVRTGRGGFYKNVKGVASPEELEKNWPKCDEGFNLERR